MPAHYARSQNILKWNFQMRKTQIKTYKFHCAGKRWCVSLRRGHTVCFAHKLEKNKSFSWPSFVILVPIRTLMITRNLDTYHLATASQPMFNPSSMRPQLCMSQQVWPLPSRVARSSSEALLAGFWGLKEGCSSIYCLCTNTCLGMPDLKIIFFTGT